MADTIITWPSSGLPSGWAYLSGSTGAACAPSSAGLPNSTNTLQMTSTGSILLGGPSDTYSGSLTGNFPIHLPTTASAFSLRLRYTDNNDQIGYTFQSSNSTSEIYSDVGGTLNVLANTSIPSFNTSTGNYLVVFTASSTVWKVAIQRLDTSQWLGVSGTTGTWQSGFTWGLSHALTSAGAGQIAFYASTASGAVIEVGTVSYGQAGTPTLAPASATLSPGGTQQLTRTGFSGLVCSYASGTPAAATVTTSTTVGAGGLVTAVAGGSSVITATGGYDATETATSTITVNSTAATSATLGTTPAVAAVGVESGAFTVTLNGTTSGQVIGLASTGSGDVFHATPGGSSVTSITIGSGSTTGTFLLVPGSTGSRNVSITASGLTVSGSPLAVTAYQVTISPSGQSTGDGSAASLTATLAGGSGTLAATTTGGTLSTSAPTSGTPFTLTVQATGSGTDTVTVTHAASGASATATVNYAVAAATTLALSGTTSGSTNSAITYTLTANGSLAGAVTVVVADAGGGTISPSPVTIGPGATSPTTATFTVTRTTATTGNVSIVSNTGGLTASGSPISLTTSLSTAVPVEAQYGVAFTGLASTLGYTVYSTTGSILQAHATGGVYEIGSSGIYTTTIAAPSSWLGSSYVLWDAPLSGVNQIAMFLQAPSGGATQSQVAIAIASTPVTVAAAGLDIAALTPLLAALLVRGYLYATGSTTPATADTYYVAGMYNGTPYYRSSALSTPQYIWTDGTYWWWTTTAPGASFPAAYFGTVSGARADGSVVQNGTIASNPGYSLHGTGGSGTPAVVAHGNAILSAFQPDGPLPSNTVQVLGQAAPAPATSTALNAGFQALNTLIGTPATGTVVGDIASGGGLFQPATITSVASASSIVVAFAGTAPEAAGLVGVYCCLTTAGLSPAKQQVTSASAVDAQHVTLGFTTPFEILPAVGNTVQIG